MNLAKRAVCLVAGHDPQSTIKFTPGAGVKFTVTSAKARCLRCGTMVEVTNAP